MSRAGHVTGEDVPIVAVVVLGALGFGAAVAAAQELDGTPPPKPKVVVVRETVEVPVKVPAKPAPAPVCAPSLSVRFEAGSARTPEFEAVALLRWLEMHSSDRLMIDGHADPRGSVAKNLALSQKRARRVARELARRGVTRERMTVRGFGAYAERSRSVAVTVAERPPCKGAE